MEERVVEQCGSTTKPHTVWDDYVPQITKGHHTDVYLHDSIEAPAEYTKVYAALLNADRHDTFTIHINNGGGFVDSGFMLINAVKASKAHVEAYITGTVASISTIIALSCDRITVGDHLSWLSHNYSGGVQGKGGEIKSQMEFMSRELASSFKEVHEGFFTTEEIEAIINDEDIWLSSSEVRERLIAKEDDNLVLLEEIAAKRKNK